MSKRKEIIWSLQHSRLDLPYKKNEFYSSDVELTFTRKGIEVDGWFDSFVGIGPTVLISWNEIEAYKQKVQMPNKETQK